MKIFSRLIALILGIVSILFTYLLLNLNILPNKYLLPVIGIIALLVLILFPLLWKKKGKTIGKICFSILAIFVIGTYLVGGNYLYNTLHLLDNVKSSNVETSIYYVIVKADSNYGAIENLEGKSLGLYNGLTPEYDKATQKVNEVVSVKSQEYSTSMETIMALISGKIDSALVGSNELSTLEEENSTLYNQVKVIYSINITSEIVTTVKEKEVTKETFNLYISGIDIEGPINTVSRSDVNIIMTVNPISHEILLTSIPRDYYVTLHGTTGYKDKLTHAGSYGIAMSINTIEDLLDIEINYYAKVNFSTVPKIVDSIGGIEVYSDKEFVPFTNSRIVIKEGVNLMDGEMALAYARERYAYASGDRHRGQNQQDVIEAIINKVTSSEILLTNYMDITELLGDSLETNLAKRNITALVKYQLEDMPSWTIKSISLDGSDSKNYTYTYTDQYTYVMEPLEETVSYANEVINKMVEGQTFAEIGL